MSPSDSQCASLQCPEWIKPRSNWIPRHIHFEADCGHRISMRQPLIYKAQPSVGCLRSPYIQGEFALLRGTDDSRRSGGRAPSHGQKNP